MPEVKNCMFLLYSCVVVECVYRCISTRGVCVSAARSAACVCVCSEEPHTCVCCGSVTLSRDCVGEHVNVMLYEPHKLIWLKSCNAGTTSGCKTQPRVLGLRLCSFALGILH